MWENQSARDNSILCRNIMLSSRIDDIIDLSVSSLCTLYRQFKQQLCFEKYLLMPSSRERISLTKYRCTNSKLPTYTYIYLYDCMTPTRVLFENKHWDCDCPTLSLSQQWYTNVSASSMWATYYGLFKNQLNFEKYLLMSNNSNRISLTQFRCSNSKMTIYNQIYLHDIDKCTLCDRNLVGDEYHYLLICPYFTESRENHMKKKTISTVDILA